MREEGSGEGKGGKVRGRIFEDVAGILSHLESDG
jgi:hypothetical protein